MNSQDYIRVNAPPGYELNVLEAMKVFDSMNIRMGKISKPTFLRYIDKFEFPHHRDMNRNRWFNEKQLRIKLEELKSVPVYHEQPNTN